MLVVPAQVDLDTADHVPVHRVRRVDSGVHAQVVLVQVVPSAGRARELPVLLLEVDPEEVVPGEVRGQVGSVVHREAVDVVEARTISSRR